MGGNGRSGPAGDTCAQVRRSKDTARHNPTLVPGGGPTTRRALAGRTGLRDGRGECGGAPEGGGVQGAIPTTSRRAISSVPRGKRGNVRSRDHHRLPLGTELIGLRQVDGMAQREPCQGSEQTRSERRSSRRHAAIWGDMKQ